MSKPFESEINETAIAWLDALRHAVVHAQAIAADEAAIEHVRVGWRS